MGNRRKYSRVMLHTTALVAVMSAFAPKVYADPTGGAVTSGNANISSAGSTTTITQSTNRAIIRWDSFDVNASEHVQFVQPNSGSITVNRIRDNKPSQINGKISANGNIVLINPNGMVFGSSSVVDVGGLVATSSDLEDDNAFMSGGHLKFTKPGKHDAKIINNGSLTVKQGGLVGLVAPNVENNGVIQATLGKVQLASGDIHTIDLAGDGLIKLEISDDVYAQSVKNTGTITADGGQILLTAAAARGIVDTLVTNTGTLRADSVTMPDGTIKKGEVILSTKGLEGIPSLNLALPASVTYTETKAQIVNTGRVSASGNQLNQMGGSITLAADLILVGDGSVIEATGDIGGGSIKIGGDYQGGGSIPTSDMIYVSDQAILNASARRRGNGGQIILWSDENTRFYGHAEAMGGIEGGNGGFIEISGKKFLDFGGTVNLLAAHGSSGLLLLDPTNITISSGADTDVSSGSPFMPTVDNATSILNITTLETALAAGNVIVQTRATGGQLGTITVDAAITWSSGYALTLDAHNAIIVNQAISAGSGSLSMIAGADVSLNAAVSGSGTLSIQQATNTLTMGVGGGAGTLNLSTADLANITDGWANIQLGRATSTVALTINATTWADNLSLLNGTGTITVAGAQAMGSNTLNITTSGGGVTFNGVTGSGATTINTGGGAIAAGAGIATTGAANFNTSGGNFSNSAAMGTGALTISTGGGTLTLGGGTTTAGTTSLNSGSGVININAALNSGTNALSLTSTGTNITTNGSGVITSGALTVATSGGNFQTGAAITASGVTSVNTGAGAISLGGTLSSGSQNMTISTANGGISTQNLTAGVLTVNSGNANISTAAITVSGNSTLSSGNGFLSVGIVNAGTNSFSLTTTGSNIGTNAITSGALSLTSGGGTITTGGAVAVTGTATVLSGGGAVNLNNAFGSTGTMTIITGGGVLTKAATGTLSSGISNITTSNASIVINSAVSATGASTWNSGNAAITIAGAVTAGTNAFSLTTTGVFDISTAAITSGNLSLTSGGGVVTTGGAVAVTGTTSVTSGGGAINLNSAFSSTGAMTLTSGGGSVTKASTGGMSSAALNVTTSGGNFSVGTTGLTTTGATTINTGAGSVAINSTWTATGQTIGVTTANNTITLLTVNSGALTLGSGGGNILLGGAANSTLTGAINITSGAGSITLTGAGTIAATTNAVNLTTTGGAINKNAALTTSTGAITFSSGGGAISIGSGILQSTTTGGITLNSAGGNITVGGGTGIQTATGTVTLNSGTTGVITVNNIVNVTGAGVLNITTDTDISLAVANALSGAGTLNISQFTISKGIGIGASMAGDILFSAAEYAMIKDGWAAINIGSSIGTGAINIGVATWTDSVQFRSGSGVITLANAMAFGANNLTIVTDGDLSLSGLLTGTGTLTIAPLTNSSNIGLGTGQTGSIHFTDTERGYLTTTWGNIVIGSTAMTGNINVGAMTWLDPITLRTNTGTININGAQTMGTNALSFNTNGDIALGANISGTGALAFTSVTAGTTFGIGDSQTGTINLTNAELARIVFGWSGITIGTTTATGAINIGAWTWDDVLTVTANTGVITMGGVTMTANNALNITTNGNINFNGNITGSGTGALVISSVAAGTTYGIGDGEAGTINLTNAELDYIQDGWTNIIFGLTTGTGLMNVGSYTWKDNLILRSAGGVISVDGASMGANNLSIQSNANIALNGAISGTGTLTIRATSNTTSMALGDGETGTIQLTSAELANIQSGWSSVVFGHTGLATTGVINVGAMTWNNNTTFTTSTSVISINGLQQMGANNLTITTSADVDIGAGLAGTGNLTFQTTAVASTIGIGTGQTGTVQLSNGELGNILNGWSTITFGSAAQTGVINIGAYTWQYDTIFRTTGVITVAGDQTTNQDMTFETNANIAINANLAGAGRLTFRGIAVTTTMTVGGTGGNIVVDATELTRLTNGWSEIIFGRNDTTTGTLIVSAATWNDNVKFITGAGLLTISGAQNLGANNLTLTTNSALTISAALTGTGNLVVEGAAAATTIGLAGGAGTLALTATELNLITDGWNSLTFGNITGTGIVTIGAYTWKDNATFITNGNVAVTGAQSSNASTNITYVTLAGNFVNTAPSTVFNGVGAGGRYLIYSRSSGTDNYGSFTPTTNVINAQTYYSQPPSSIAAGQNTMIYSNGSSKILYLQIDNKTKVYGDALPVLTYTYLGGLQGGDLLSSAITGATLSAAGALVTDNVGTMTTITGMFSTALGYTTVVTNGTLSVTKAPVLISVDNASKVYGDATPTPTLSYVGFRNGDTSAVLDTQAIVSSGTNEFTGVGTYAFAVSGAVDNNYTFNYASGTLTINKAVLTATTQNATREYGLTNPALNIVYTGFKNGEDQSVINTLATAATTATDASNVADYAITGSGGIDDNYSFTYADTGVLSVTKATITVTGQSDTREYGLDNPTFTAAYTGFRNGDDELDIDTLATIGSSATITSNVGNYAINASAADDTNYQFTYVAGALSITKATLTATTQNATREYGLTNPALNIVYTGFRNTDTQGDIDVLATASTSATSASNVGNYAITATGASDGNYNFTYANTGQLSVTQATLTATTQNATRQYGLANPALNIVYTGFRNGDDEGDIGTLATASTAAVIGSDVGTYDITASGGIADNYIFNYVDSGDLTITKAMLTATTQDATREYGLTNPPLNIVYTGFRNGDVQGNIDTLAIASTAAVIGSNVGTYAVSASGALDSNYDFTYVNTGNLTITKATLTATTQNATREYGLANPALNVVYTGFRNGDVQGNIDTLATISTTALVTSNVGSYAINASAALDNNYSFTYVNTGNLSITKAMLTATTQDATREYGLANPALNIVYTGFRNGDVQGDIDTLATASTAATSASNVGSYGISSTGGLDNNYDFTYANTGNLTITKAMLTATTQDATREYGLANPALNIAYTGFRNGDDDADINALATISTSATIGSNVGTYDITASGALDNNYDFTYVDSGDLTITKATLTATTQNATREYGLANPALNVVYTGFRNGDDDTDINTLATASTAAVIGSNVGTYDITASGALDNNYDFTYIDSGDLTITKATLTATTQNATREYGLTNPVLNVVYTGFRNGDVQGDIDTLATASTAATSASNVGSYGISSTGGLDNNYDFTYANTGNLTITKAMLTATTQDATREYGLANPALNIVYTGFRNGDDDADINTLATASTATVIGSNVGTYGISASGAVDNNYDFTYANTGNLTITKATLTATTQDATREYGVANPTLNIVYAGFRNGDDDTDINTLATASTAAVIGSNVGTYDITASGALDNNYDFTYIDSGDLTITKATLTATTQNATREYGLTNPVLNVVYTGFRNGDVQGDIDILATASTAATSASNVGSYAITGSGASDDNYDFTYANTGNLTITKATLTATTQNATREYGLANPALSIVYTGFRNGDDDADINTLATASTAAVIGSHVGSYGISASGAVDNNYDFTYANTGNLTVTKAMLTATTQDATREYGLANPALSIVYTGFRNGDDSGDINTLATASTAAVISSNVGTYGISASGALDNNYDFTYANTGNLTITKATLTATTQNATREYGLANPALSIIYTGFRNGDDSTDLTTLATAGTTATMASNVGVYGITGAGAIDDNYDFTYVDSGQLNITKAMLTATTQSATREYGLTNPTLTVSYTGFRNGDDDGDINTLATVSTSATIGSNVGAYGISASGALDNNYDFTYANTGSLTITKAMLTATTQNATRQYGLANPTLNIVYAGFRNGDDSGDINTLATASTAAVIGSNVGTYGISASGALDNNYDFTYANTGNLTITKAMLTATTQNATREYGLANPTLTVSYTGFRNGDDSSDIDTLATASTTAAIASNVGSYGISATGALDTNYDFTYANTGLLHITKATLTATTQNATREYGLANPTLTVSYTGFRNGDDDGDINTLATVSTSATIGSNVGAYGVSASGALDNNYQFNYANTGVLNITKAMLMATTQSTTRQYGLNNPTLTVSYTGFRNGDDSGDINTLATASTAAVIGSNVGTYGISASGATDNNYDFTYTNSGNLTITKATLSVVADDQIREIGEADPTLTATYTGFRNGDDTDDIDTLASLATTANPASPLGDYTITVSGALDNNYQFVYTNGIFFVVADSTPPPPPTPTPPAPPTSLPPTVEQSVSLTPTIINNVGFGLTFYSDLEQRPAAYIRKPDIIFIADDQVMMNSSSDYLIAMSDSLRREYYGLINQEGQ